VEHRVWLLPSIWRASKDDVLYASLRSRQDGSEIYNYGKTEVDHRTRNVRAKVVKREKRSRGKLKAKRFRRDDFHRQKHFACQTMASAFNCELTAFPDCRTSLSLSLSFSLSLWIIDYDRGTMLERRKPFWVTRAWRRRANKLANFRIADRARREFARNVYAFPRRWRLHRRLNPLDGSAESASVGIDSSLSLHRIVIA